MLRFRVRSAWMLGGALGAWVLAAGVAASPDPPTLMVLGDSLSTAYGFDVERGWVRLLAKRLRREGYTYRVANASISGDTTRGALARLPRALEAHAPEVAVVALGGNDGLRGIPIEETRANLRRIVTTLQARSIGVLLAGVRLPPNYGPAYGERFRGVYRELARALDVPLVASLLEGIAERPELMQPDGIHPRAAAQPRIVDNLWPRLEPLL